MFGKKLVINISWVDLAGCRFYCDGARRICDFLTRPIGEREDEIESGVVLSISGSLFNLPTAFLGQQVMPADTVEANILLQHIRKFVAQKFL